MAKKRKRYCGALTKRGTKCKSTAVLADGKCIAHASKDEQAKRGFGGSQPNAGRPRRVRASELQRQVVEAAAEELMKPYLEALGLEMVWDINEEDERPTVTIKRVSSGLVMHGESKDGRIIVSRHKDLAGQVAVIEKMFDRVYGRPKQTTELAGPDGGPIRVDVPRSSDRAADVARILAGAGALPSTPPPHDGRRRAAPPAPARASNGHGSG